MASSALDVRTPGVHIFESAAPVRAVPPRTPIGAHVGQAVRGRTDKAQLVSSWSDFVRLYGGFPSLPDAHVYGSLAVFLHFQNGGGPVWFVRTVGAGGVGAKKEDLKDHSDAAASIDVHAQNIGTWGNDVSIAIERWETSNVAAQAVVQGAVSPGAADVKSLLALQVGDVVDVLDETGAAQGWFVIGSVLADGALHTGRGLVAGRSYILLADDTQANTGAGVDAAGFTLRSSSTHRASTRLNEAYADNAVVVKVASSSGFETGSLITVLLVALCNDDATRDRRIEGHARVTAISGQSLTVSAELADGAGAALNAAVPIDVKAFAKTTAVDDKLELTAVPSGSDGNVISYEIDIDAAVATVTVTGNHIKVALLAAAKTLNDAALAITASATASKLVTAVATQGGAIFDAIPADVAKRFLTGGTYARVVTQEFDLAVRESGATVERHEGLSLVAASTNYIGSRLGGTATPTVSDDNQSSRIIVLRDAALADAAVAIAKLPRSFKDTQLAGGVADAVMSDVEALGSSVQGAETGLYLLQGKQNLEFMAIPGFASSNVAREGATLASELDTMFLLDTPQSDTTFDAIASFVVGELAMDDHFLAVYGPWLKMADPRSSARIIEVPPTIFAGATWSVTQTAGDHMSPANVPLRGPKEASIRFSQAQLGSLNEDLKVNVIRHVEGQGFRVMGARTHFSGPDTRKFIGVRRWLNAFRRWARIGLLDLVFAPANEDTLRLLSGRLDGFLSLEHSKGALFPARDRARAYNVKADTETTTAADMAAGRIVAAVRVSPVTPAEKILIGIVSESGGITLTESVE